MPKESYQTDRTRQQASQRQRGDTAAVQGKPPLATAQTMHFGQHLLYLSRAFPNCISCRAPEGACRLRRRSGAGKQLAMVGRTPDGVNDW